MASSLDPVRRLTLPATVQHDQGSLWMRATLQTREYYPRHKKVHLLQAGGQRKRHRSFEKVAVEDPTYAIFQHLAGLPAVGMRYKFSDLRFSDNSRQITQASGGIPVAEDEGLNNEKPERRSRTGPNKRAASEQRVKPRPTNPNEPQRSRAPNTT